ncbi:MAG: hypothetical protein KC620_15400, partial [Myxococcales bacterium]|nr:hypothetical protein [Myxococcales bacterium]
RLNIEAIDLDTGRRAVVRDHLSDLRDDDPFTGPVVSRLGQAHLPLARLVGSVLLFSDHPVGRARGAPLFAPAFRAVPAMHAVTDDFEGPALPEATAELLKRVRRPLRATLTVRRGADASDDTMAPVHFVWQGRPVAIELTPALQLNARKLLLGAGDAPATLNAVLGPAGEAARLWSAEDDLGARVWPSHDPRLFRLTPAQVFQRAIAASTDDAIAHRFGRTIAALFGGAAPDALDALAEEWQSDLPGLDAHYRAALARGLLGIAPAPLVIEEVTALLDATLFAATLPPAEVPGELMALLLGRRAGRAERIDGALLYRALWVGARLGLLDERIAELRTLFTIRADAASRKPTPWDVCVHALLVALLSADAATEDEAQGEEPLDADAVLGPARDYLDAHLADLRPQAGRGEPPPWPDFAELYALADTQARLRGHDPLDAPLRALGLPRLRLAEAAAEALLDGARDPLTAADAWLAIAAAGLADWFVA